MQTFKQANADMHHCTTYISFQGIPTSECSISIFGGNRLNIRFNRLKSTHSIRTVPTVLFYEAFVWKVQSFFKFCEHLIFQLESLFYLNHYFHWWYYLVISVAHIVWLSFKYPLFWQLPLTLWTVFDLFERRRMNQVFLLLNLPSKQRTRLSE